MARQPRTPSTLAKRSKKISGQDSPATAGGQAAQESPPETPPASPEQQPASAEASVGRMLDAAKALIEAIAEGMDTLLALRAELRKISSRLDLLLARMPDGARLAEAGDYQPGRDRDPGDAVPPGVAVMSPTPLTETDEVVLHKLEDLPKRGRRGKSGPRAKP